MSASHQITTSGTRVGANRQIVALWSFGCGFIVLIFGLLLLSRVGLPAATGIQLTLVVVATCFAIATWFGKTMTSVDYFYAGRSSPSAVIGLGGMGDWLGGGLLLILATSPLQERVWLIIGLMSAIAIQMVLFSRTFQRSGVSTVPGFFAWRYGSRKTGLAALLVASVALMCLLLAELQVGVTVLTSLTGLPASTTLMVFLAIASLPALLGGWRALHLTSSFLALCILISLLAPAIATGFFNMLLAQNQALGMTASPLPPLSALFVIPESSILQSGTGWSPVLLVALLAMGLSVLPASISRLSLSNTSQDAQEGGTWSALAAFLAISALPLSLLLIAMPSADNALATVLERSAVLHTLPHLALLVAAATAFGVSLFALGSAVARTMRRTRNLDPGERSMFTTRLACFAIVIALWASAGLAMPDPQMLIFGAVAVLAGGLFPAMVAACWMARLPVWSVVLALFSGSLVPLLLMSAQFSPQIAGTALASIQGIGFVFIAAAGFGAASLSLLSGRVVVHFSKTQRTDAALSQVRSSGFED